MRYILIPRKKKESLFPLDSQPIFQRQRDYWPRQTNVALLPPCLHFQVLLVHITPLYNLQITSKGILSFIPKNTRGHCDMRVRQQLFLTDSPQDPEVKHDQGRHIRQETVGKEVYCSSQMNEGDSSIVFLYYIFVIIFQTGHPRGLYQDKVLQKGHLQMSISSLPLFTRPHSISFSAW